MRGYNERWIPPSSMDVLIATTKKADSTTACQIVKPYFNGWLFEGIGKETQRKRHGDNDDNKIASTVALI